MSTDGSRPKQWEVRAALRAMARSREASTRRNPAEALVAAAMEIVAEADDFTVKQVSERAGVALQTFYRHFGSKDELILAMLEESSANSIQQLVRFAEEADDPVERLRRLVQIPFGDVEVGGSALRLSYWRARERQRLTQRFPREVQASWEHYRVGVAGALHRLKALGLIDSEDPALDAILIQQEVVSTFYMAQSHGTEYTPQELADRVWELTWHGLAVRDHEPLATRAPAGG